MFHSYLNVGYLFLGRSRYYSAKIIKIHPNGTYDLSYGGTYDGEKELYICATMIRLHDAEAHRLSDLEDAYNEQYEIEMGSKGAHINFLKNVEIMEEDEKKNMEG